MNVQATAAVPSEAAATRAAPGTSSSPAGPARNASGAKPANATSRPTDGPRTTLATRTNSGYTNAASGAWNSQVAAVAQTNPERKNVHPEQRGQRSRRR